MPESSLVTFEQEVQQAAVEANLPDDPPMTEAEEAIPAEEPKSVESVPKEEPKAEIVAKEDVEPAKKEPETVPLAVHIRQREKHDRELQGLRTQLGAMQQQFAQGDQRLQQLTEMLAPAKELPPDPKTDVLGAMMYQQEQLAKQIEVVNNRMLQADTQTKTRVELERFAQFVIADEKRFEQNSSDYKQAIDWLKSVKAREYQALGLDEHQSSARVQQDAMAVAQHAVAQGASPAEFGYRLAKALGFQGGAQKQDASKQEPENVIAMRQAGGERNKGSGGGAQSGGQITFADLATMDNDEFIKVTSGNSWKKLAGGD